MPLYEYECETCRYRFEQIQKFSDPPIDKCPQCGGPVHKLVSSPAFQFKGSGWYVTDYARKDQPSGEKTEGAKTEGKSDAKAEAKTDQKTETKTETKTEAKSGGTESSPTSAKKD